MTSIASLPESAATVPALGGATILEGLRRGASIGRRLAVLDADLRAQDLPYAELVEASEDRASVLIGRYGVAPGDRVCLFGPTSPALLAALLGIWRAGAVAVILPMPRRTDPANLVRELVSRVGAARSRLVLTDAGLSRFIGDGPRGVTVTDYHSLSGGGGRSLPADPGPHDVALLQFTSGTTSNGRIVAVRHGQMVGNPVTVVGVVGIEPGETVVSWLPLYHDMGVMTVTGCIGAGLNLCLLATETFVGNPNAWLRAVSTYGAALTVAPNFAYGLAANQLLLDHTPLDLSKLRCAINGAEVVDRQTVNRFVTAAGRHGTPPTAMCPMYGLAEATLAVSVTRPTEPARFLRVNRTALEGGRAVPQDDLAGGRDLADCGQPIPGTTVTITDASGQPVPDGTVGEVRVLGPGVAGHYWTPDGAAPAEPMCDTDGRLMTGDLGFRYDGGLYLCGRQKDMIIVGGRNLYPEDYEYLAEQVPGVRAGNVMAFGLPGTERMVVVAETRLSGADATAVGQQVLDTARQELSHAPHEVVLVPPGSLPKTSSGKRRRQRCQSDYLHGALTVVAAVR